jgi:hypothetical protein
MDEGCLRLLVPVIIIMTIIAIICYWIGQNPFAEALANIGCSTLVVLVLVGLVGLVVVGVIAASQGPRER